tara:strand:- start:866 stop:2530 length:1665 start_codon:yes stop_codon:yes gene_type:complete
LLSQLFIADFAIIDKLNLDFKRGMTVLTGETGAGKSILLDALGLILGDRADTNVIRGNSDKTDITAIFFIKNNDDVNQKLKTLEIESNNDELFIRRTIKKDGRSRAYINDTPVPIQTLRNIGESLIEIHGQHAHQSLSQPKKQRQLLDQYGKYDKILTKLTETYNDLASIDKKINELEISEVDLESTLTLLKYQIEELNKLAIEKSEYAKLSEEYKRQSNSQHIIETCQEIITELSETDNSIGTRLSKCRGKIDELCQIDSAFKNISNLVETAMIQLNEATLEIRSYLDGFNMDISQLSELEKKLDKLNELARKYKTRPEELSNHLNQLIIKLNELEGGIEKQEELKQEKEKLVTEYHNISERLTKERIQTAIVFSNEITNKLHQLGMSGKLEIKIETMPNNEPRPQGMDNVIFMVSTNPGQPLRPITKVASGGELSRIGLAIQIICSKENNSSAMIFDEVDAGIGGSIAEIVGKLLNALAKNNQILCVTHLPQVASCGHHHFKVTKKAVAGETCTKVIELNQKERVNEIARMLAGMEVTDESLANAEKMLALK